MYICIRKPTKQHTAMAKKADSKTIEREKKALLELLLKKAGITYKDLVSNSVGIWVASNIDLLTEQEKKQFKSLVL